MSSRAYVVYGQDGLKAYDKNDVLRIFLSALDTCLSFYDSAGVPRCEIGNLPPRGTSAGGYGFRVNDASGAPLYDSTGVIQAASVIASTHFSSSNITTASNVTYVTLTGSTTTFTLLRPLGVMFHAAQTSNVTTTGAGTFAYTKLFVDGVAQNISQRLWDLATVGYSSAPLFAFSPNLSAGPHSVEIRVATDDVNTHLNTWGGEVYCIQMGS